MRGILGVMTPSRARHTGNQVTQLELVEPAANCASILPNDLQEFFIPVHDEVRLWPSEVRLVNHPAVARLSDIFQLSQTHLVYRGATHSRFEHAVGTLHAAQLMLEALERNYKIANAKGKAFEEIGYRRADPPRVPEIAFIRLSALLHDIGHLAAGHTFEDELGLLDKHDGDERLNHILDKKIWHDYEESFTLREIIDQEYIAFAQATETGKTASEIYLDIVSKDRQHIASRTGSTFRLQICRDLVGNTICADLLDYLPRDFHHIGKVRHFDKRLLDYMEIRLEVKSGNEFLVVNLRSADNVRSDAVSAIVNFLNERYELAEFALFHRTKLCATAMLERVVAEVSDATGDDSWFGDQLDSLLALTDMELLTWLRNEIHRLDPRRTNRRLVGADRVARDLRLRQLHKRFYGVDNLALGIRADEIRQNFAGKAGAANRLNTVRSLEEDFGLPPGSIVIYCPGSEMNAKIANVKILVHDRVATLKEIEDEGTDAGLTGGVLEAQQVRFKRLWRMLFAISPAAKEQLGEAQMKRLIQCVDRVVLGKSGPGETPEEAALALVIELTNMKDSALWGRNLVKAAVGTRKSELIRYPLGAPTLRSLTE